MRNESSEATGLHFNLPGHKVSDMRVTVLEKVFKNERAFRETRESLFIREFETEHVGMNKEK